MTSSDRYLIPGDRCRCEIEVARSRFITTVLSVNSEAAAQSFVAEIKAEFSDANHNCWAYLVGRPGSCDRVGMSDDGEPHGAAGKPMLTVLQHSGLGDVAVVVTRYFGGTKLGKGGMVKAYTAAVKTALDQVPRTEHIAWACFTVTINYSLVTTFERCIEKFEVEILETNYAAQVVYRVRLPEERVEAFTQQVNDLSCGQGALQALE